MSLILSRANPSGTMVKTLIAPPGIVQIGPIEMPIEEFCMAAMYVLTNTDLEPVDPRLEFVEDVKRLTRIKGFNIRNNPKACRLGEKKPAGRISDRIGS